MTEKIEDETEVTQSKNEEAFKLEELLAQVRPDNLHEEIESGPPVGKEIW